MARRWRGASGDQKESKKEGRRSNSSGGSEQAAPESQRGQSSSSAQVSEDPVVGVERDEFQFVKLRSSAWAQEIGPAAIAAIRHIRVQQIERFVNELVRDTGPPFDLNVCRELSEELFVRLAREIHGGAEKA